MAERAVSKLDFPTPLCPASTVSWPCRMSRSASMPIRLSMLVCTVAISMVA